jgi:hypothetical protein
MRQILALVMLLLVLGLNSCRCSDPPPVGPIEEQASAIGFQDETVELTLA